MHAVKICILVSDGQRLFALSVGNTSTNSSFYTSFAASGQGKNSGNASVLFDIYIAEEGWILWAHVSCTGSNS